MRPWLGLLGLALLGIAPAVPVEAQQAASIVATGWWTGNPLSQEKESPDAFEVGRGPDGSPSSVAALRVLVDVPLDRAVLMAAASGGFRQDAAAIAVCPTDDLWEPTNGGDMADAPEPDCGSGSLALEADGGGRWTAEVTALLSGVGSHSLMVVPDPEVDPGPLDPGFTIEFEPASLEAMAARAPSPQAPVASGSAAPSGSAPELPPPAMATTIEPSPTSLIDPPAPQAAEPAADPPLQAPGSFPVRPAAELPDEADPRPWWRLGFLVPAAGGVGFGAVRGRRFLADRGLGEAGV